MESFRTVPGDSDLPVHPAYLLIMLLPPISSVVSDGSPAPLNLTVRPGAGSFAFMPNTKEPAPCVFQLYHLILRKQALPKILVR